MIEPNPHPLYDLILASTSPRRRQLLSTTGLKFRVITALVKEPPYNPAQSPRHYVQQMALRKAQNVAIRFPQSWVIGADTIVVLGAEVLGKPASEDDARQMLTQLSGHGHQVMTGCAIISERCPDLYLETVVTHVTFKELSPLEIDWYLATGEPFDKAGAYGIQGLGAGIVREINGSYTNVVGLPLCEVVEFLSSVGVTPFPLPES